MQYTVVGYHADNNQSYVDFREGDDPDEVGAFAAVADNVVVVAVFKGHLSPCDGFLTCLDPEDAAELLNKED